jgi:hypothetical protein
MNWNMDSGATDHITGELEKITVRDSYRGQDQVHTASGSSMKISNVGSTILHTPHKRLHLHNILHVPTANKSLALVHRLASNNNVLIAFHPNLFLIKDRATKRIIHQGKCEGGLYPLRLQEAKSRKQVFGAIKPSTSRWHSRLGHPSFSIVERVVKNNSLPCVSDDNSSSVCDSCLKAMSHQLPYPKSTSVSHAPLDLIFYGVWEPAPILVGRHTYYVSFIDDYSKYTWIHLLKKKSNAFQVFHDFQNLVERKFNKKIICVQSDWGGEYEKLNSLFQRIGISHHVSCPHAHQQNGSAERKHRHIVEVGLVLLANASMPLKFWDEAFLTATYLINMLPSKVIDFDTPTQCLLGETPNYSSLRVFRCACWPNLRPYNNHKLPFRSTRCVFLGYNSRHKGFKCLEPSTRQVYISRDVIFDESIFPFESLHPNTGARLRKVILLFPNHLLNPDSGGVECTNSNVTNDHPNHNNQNSGEDALFQDSEDTEDAEDPGAYFQADPLPRSGAGSQADPPDASPGVSHGSATLGASPPATRGGTDTALPTAPIAALQQLSAPTGSPGSSTPPHYTALSPHAPFGSPTPALDQMQAPGSPTTTASGSPPAARPHTHDFKAVLLSLN